MTKEEGLIIKRLKGQNKKGVKTDDLLQGVDRNAGLEALKQLSEERLLIQDHEGLWYAL